MTKPSADNSTMRGFATEVVSKLRTCGFVAYFAGGCVRDGLLELEPKDFDVATSAKPDEVRKVFGHKRTLAIGASFGVITVLGPKPHQVEVATFRSDGNYSDGRHPDGVVFSTAKEDASRRDFTINGMFLDPIEDQVIDFVGGQKDLQAKTIRAIGNPDSRIEEDRLRMLRAVRFAATYGFQIEPATMGAIQANSDKISVVSQERITAELTRMLAHKNRALALSMLKESKLLGHVVPSLEPLANDLTRWDSLCQLVSSQMLTNFTQVIGILLGPDGANLSSDIVDQICRQMKLSNEHRQTIVWLVAHQHELGQADRLPFSKLQPLLIQNPIRDALAVLRCLAEVKEKLHVAVKHCERLLDLKDSELNPPMLIRGNDLKDIGISPGPGFKEILDDVRNRQLDGLILSKKEALERAQELSDSMMS